MKYDEQIVIRCSGKLYRAIGSWAKQNDIKTGELTRKVLEVAFGVEETPLPLPPGVKPLKPTQGAPGKA